MSKAVRLRAAAALAAATLFVGPAWAQAEVVTVPGGTVTHTIPGTATPPIGPLDVATPPITVPRTCAGTVFCAGPIYVPPQTIVHVPRVNPIPVTPPITVTVSTTDIVAVVDPALTTLITIPPTTIPVPNPFGGDPIPVDICPSSCAVPGASVLDGATGSVTVTACVGATCETQTVPVQVGDTGPGQVCFTQATKSIGEGGSTVTLLVQRTGGSFNDAYVNWSTQNGTALAPSDYLSGSGQLHWGHEQSGTRSVTVNVVGDSTDEPDENFSIVLSGAMGATLCQPSVATVTILDDDNPPAGSIRFASGAYSLSEGGGSFTVEVVREGGSFGTASAIFNLNDGNAMAPADYVDQSTQLTWPDGTSGSQFVTVVVNEDTADEVNETFTATLSGVTGASAGNPSTSTLTIIDNDEPLPTDDDPDQFVFIDRSGVARSTYIYSNVVTVTGINTAANATASGGEFSIRTNGVCDSTGTWQTSGTVASGQLVCVRHVSSSAYATAMDTTLTIGSAGRSDTFTSTTVDEPDDDPDQFVFVDRFAVARSTYIYSNIVTITGINTATSITASGGQFSIRTNGICDSTGTWQTSGTVTNGQTVCVRHLSSADFSTSVSTTLTVGSPGVSDTFTSTTRDEPLGCNPPPGQICP